MDKETLVSLEVSRRREEQQKLKENQRKYHHHLEKAIFLGKLSKYQLSTKGILG